MRWDVNSEGLGPAVQNAERIPRLRRKRRWILLCALFIPVASFAALVFWFRQSVEEPFPARGGFQERLVEIPKGYSLGRIGRLLQREGIVSSERLFRWHVRLQSLEKELKAGEYRFDSPASIEQVTDKLVRGDVYLRRVTIPEGLDAAQVAHHLASQGWGREDLLLDAVRDPSPVRDLDPRAEDLEGYLFPDTYHLTKNMTEKELIAIMVERMRSIWTPDRRRLAESLGMRLRDVLTLASLIEKEARLDDERPLVSAVFHNRLRSNMKLACDPTVIYAVKRIKDYDGIIHQSDLRLDSPYNTYLYPGLPPGPIANPGLASIDAALKPADADFLYFVARNDGSHAFSRTYREHQRAVQQFQR